MSSSPGTLDADILHDALAGQELLDRQAMFDARVAALDQQHPGYARWWHGFTPRMTERLGVLVVPPIFAEEHARELEERGEFSTVTGVPIEGLASQCHANTAALWLGDEIEGIATGYALSSDGLWRQHSWGLDGQGRIVETTEERIAYFGFELSFEEAQDFVEANA